MATKYGGYMDRVVLVDLTEHTVENYPWTDEDREKYIGGKIMAAKVLNDHLSGVFDRLRLRAVFGKRGQKRGQLALHKHLCARKCKRILCVCAAREDVQRLAVGAKRCF